MEPFGAWKQAQAMVRVTALASAVFVMLLVGAPGSGERNDYSSVSEAHRGCVEDAVDSIVRDAVRTQKRMAASLLRLHFHDCFVHGCDGSVLLDGNNSEKLAPGNNNSLRGFEVVDALKESITSKCDIQISCADILALAARSAVQSVSASHVTWSVPFGRYDSKSPYSNLTKDLPGTEDTMDIILKKFAAQGISDPKQVIALIGGGHTIGRTHCSFSRRRLYGNLTSISALYSDPQYVTYLRQECPKLQTDEQASAIEIDLDNTSRDSFDLGFFRSLREGRVAIRSDMVIGDPANSPDVRAAVTLCTDDAYAFYNTFASGMEVMGSAHILGREEGEIRTNCRRPNGYSSGGGGGGGQHYAMP
ncbi:hypothetical protein KP509_05G061200 [Ceratopteris richardii]|uniref:Peroxidase n=1 Tax=Ceratopteris richardii TaxID=49495 RepID=A0A8T2UYU7_CERRI|nr:hypothetical protein KP509_05G061200 [Ceratopteris richardii]